MISRPAPNDSDHKLAFLLRVAERCRAVRIQGVLRLKQLKQTTRSGRAVTGVDDTR
jgi:hypothetical protein